MNTAGTDSTLFASRAVQLGKLAFCYFGAWIIFALTVKIARFGDDWVRYFLSDPISESIAYFWRDFSGSMWSPVLVFFPIGAICFGIVQTTRRRGFMEYLCVTVFVWMPLVIWIAWPLYPGFWKLQAVVAGLYLWALGRWIGLNGRSSLGKEVTGRFRRDDLIGLIAWRKRYWRSVPEEEGEKNEFYGVWGWVLFYISFQFVYWMYKI